MNTINPAEKKTRPGAINWRLFGILLGLVAIGLLALIPYGLSLAGQTFTMALVPQLISQFLVQILLYSVLILAGTFLGKQIGLGAPILEAVVQGRKCEKIASSLWGSIVIGLIAGTLMIVADVYLFVPLLESQLEILGEAVHPPAWQGVLASFYGGIVEEVMSRLFLFTLLAWLGSKISRGEDGKPSPAVMWISILISGLAFGLGHLPAAAQLGVALTPLYVIRTLALNGVGLIYGWLYWKRGLESAMLAHFATDLAVHGLGALLLV